MQSLILPACLACQGFLYAVHNLVQHHAPACFGSQLAELCMIPVQIVRCVLQDSRLNYVQQHAQRAGMDEARLEDLRVAASRSSPMGDALDLCVRYTDEEALSRLGPKLTQLIRYGFRLPGPRWTAFSQGTHGQSV